MDRRMNSGMKSSLKAMGDRECEVVVYTMGKVASTSISTSLNAHGIPCYDVHLLEPGRYLAKLQNIVLDGKEPNSFKGRVETVLRRLDGAPRIPAHMIDSLAVMRAVKDGKPIKVISLIREPISRNISAVFQTLPLRYRRDPEAVMARLRKYSVKVPDRWFDRDFKPVTGIDVFSEEHDRTADHFRFEKGQFDVVIIKTAASDERKSEIISAFLDTPITLKRANEAKNKWYRQSYERLVAAPDQIRDAYVEECFRLKYFQAFFSDAERGAVAEKFGYKGKV